MAPIRNPFIAGGPVPPELFIGRAREINGILNRITAVRPASSSIHGQARIGKTSLLHYLKSNQVAKEWRLSSRKFTFSFTDCGGIDIPFAYNFWRRVIGELRNETQNKQIYEELKNFNLTAEQPNLNVRDLYGHLARLDHRFVLLLDEFENVIKQDRGLLDTLRGLVNEQLVTLVISTTTSLPRLVNNIDFGGGQRFNNPFDTREVKPFSKKETHELIDKALNGTDIPFSEADYQYVWEVSLGHPFKVQFACSRIFEEKVFAEKERP